MSSSGTKWHRFTFPCSSPVAITKCPGTNSPDNYKTTLRGGIKRRTAWRPQAGRNNIRVHLSWCLSMTRKDWAAKRPATWNHPQAQTNRRTCSFRPKNHKRSSPAEIYWGDPPQPLPKTMAVYMSCSSIQSPVLPEPTIHLPWAA